MTDEITIAVPILKNAVKSSEYTRTIWTATPAANVSEDQLLTTRYWQHIASSTSIGDRIEVTPEDGAYFQELLVVDVRLAYVKVVSLRRINLSEVAEATKITDTLLVAFKGPVLKWCVLRIEDNERLVTHLATKIAAQKAAIDYQSQVG